MALLGLMLCGVVLLLYVLVTTGRGKDRRLEDVRRALPEHPCRTAVGVMAYPDRCDTVAADLFIGHIPVAQVIELVGPLHQFKLPPLAVEVGHGLSHLVPAPDMRLGDTVYSTLQLTPPFPATLAVGVLGTS